ncbi:hypothetical protein ORIO_05865 [Cereibacter azotoformans]|uniref:SH3 domain-containing protein n=1 Tax=Cereibacter sphaeroides (strain ATCC 17025 / ATH 2.4.3) TaxID=349102 RepID=A4WRU0_CERS5|nr:hypothetical protein [Cereibacter azotoformans]AXQ93346.1 hypothetical protein D0Z66_05655 [Cereibacter sphaeroides]UIJ31664.1 hypothetical protein LV780_05650 [Cereibacter azotoformans]ULB09452.1 hypothetical protein ORIO_05865 [Cereibacter azotoformans]
MLHKVLCVIVACAALTPGLAPAQGAAEPWEGGCLVRGLDPNGDGFLSVRRGPGSENAEIARVRNGDALFLDHRKCQGKWCLAEGGVVGGRQTDIRGWFYTAWCEFYP